MNAKKNGCNIHWKTGMDSNTVFEGKNTTHSGSACPNTFLGYASYLGTNTKLGNTQIGRYSSIAADVSVLMGNHPTRDFVSTHPEFCFENGYVEKENCFGLDEICPYADRELKKYCIIGNDVWIGRGTKIKCGVKIGDGAIVGGYSMVTKDVPPYAIVGGMPAKIIRYRFDEEDIQWLLNLQWWNKGEEWLQKYGKYFYDVKELRRQVKEDED